MRELAERSGVRICPRRRRTVEKTRTEQAVPHLGMQKLHRKPFIMPVRTAVHFPAPKSERERAPAVLQNDAGQRQIHSHANVPGN